MPIWIIATALLMWASLDIQATLADGRPAAARCMSHGEAKRVYRGAYLHWRRETHGRRCWGVLDRRRTGRVGLEPRAEARDHILPDETQQPEKGPPLFANLLDHPSWAYERDHWVDGARRVPWLEVEPLGPVVPVSGTTGALAEYSSFAPGQEPDVWPQMEAAAPGWGAAAVALLVGLLVGASLMWRQGRT